LPLVVTHVKPYPLGWVLLSLYLVAQGERSVRVSLHWVKCAVARRAVDHPARGDHLRPAGTDRDSRSLTGISSLAQTGHRLESKAVNPLRRARAPEPRSPFRRHATRRHGMLHADRRMVVGRSLGSHHDIYQSGGRDQLPVLDPKD